VSIVVPPGPPRSSPHGDDPDLLIREARERQRRRRRRIALVLLALAGGVAVAVAVVRTGGGTPAIEQVPGGPIVAVRAFAGRGRLAFVSRRSLWVLDGTKRSLRELPTTPPGLHPLHPSFSPDGKWLAFLETATTPAFVAGGATAYGQVWLARGDGSDAHPLPGLANATLSGWSPARDVLAVVAGPVSKRIPYGVLTTVRLIAPGSPGRLLLRSRYVRGAVWSPDGRQLAVVTETPRLVDTVASYPISGGGPVVWARFHPRQRVNGMRQPLVEPAGWWRGFGIGVWVFGDGMTHDLDATPLDVITAPGAKPRFLAETLSDGTTRVVDGGRSALAVVADVSHGINGGRVVWDAKQLQICTPSPAHCTPIVGDRSRVTLDPAWAPSGRRLAFVEAPDRSSAGWPQPVLRRWYGQHVLRIYDVRTHRLHAVAAASGATAPLWSSDGKSLVYFADDGVWLLQALDASPVRIATPVFAPSRWPAFYGQMSWPSQLAWWSPDL
jgi:dipeptidyl aminopeptidase/acylaminoacyl peptidase